jgi:threonine/homoserine/homoserine lactone efflux protein
MLSNSMVHGFRRSTATAIGDLSANTIQMLIASLGLAVVVQESREFFAVIKWAGVAYLIYIGMRKILSSPTAKNAGAIRSKSLKALYWQGFITSAANPKAVVFFAALFPQFVDPTTPTGVQFLTLGITYIAIDGIFLFSYGKFSGWIGRRINSSSFHGNKISGALLILAALLLGMKEIDVN